MPAQKRMRDGGVIFRTSHVLLRPCDVARAAVLASLADEAWIPWGMDIEAPAPPPVTRQPATNPRGPPYMVRQAAFLRHPDELTT